MRNNAVGWVWDGNNQETDQKKKLKINAKITFSVIFGNYRSISVHVFMDCFISMFSEARVVNFNQESFWEIKNFNPSLAIKFIN